MERLQVWLSDRKSPLAPYSSSILESPYWSTIIGICHIEQSKDGGICNRLPGGKNWNLWGIGGSSGLAYYSTPEQGIQAISELLAKYETEYGKTTIEQLNGFYVLPASNNWLNTVLKSKQLIENL